MDPGQVPVQGWSRVHCPVAENVPGHCRLSIRVIKWITDRKDQEAAIPLSANPAAGEWIVEHCSGRNALNGGPQLPDQDILPAPLAAAADVRGQ